MIKQLPLVSIIIPCYKQAHYLGQAIESALGQSYPRIEVIVVDDGSPDNTPEVCASYGNRIRYIRQENRGLPGARNTGIEVALGEFVHFLDSDDALHTCAIESQMKIFDSHTDCAVVYCGWYVIDINNKTLASHAPVEYDTDTFHCLLEQNIGPPNTFTVRRDCIVALKGFDIGLKSCEDWDMWLRIAAAGHLFVRNEQKLAYYRVYPGSMSKNGLRMWQTGRRVMQRSLKYHSNCGMCKQSVTKGMLAWREDCYGRLESELRAAKSASYFNAILWMLRSLFRHHFTSEYLAWKLKNKLNRIYEKYV